MVKLSYVKTIATKLYARSKMMLATFVLQQI
jgi:hypothetical protein